MTQPAGQNKLPNQTPNSSSPICSIDADLGQQQLLDSKGQPLSGRLQVEGYVTPAWRYLMGRFITSANSGPTTINDAAVWANTAGTQLKDLSWTTVTQTLLTLFTATKPGIVPASGGGTANFLRADGTWALTPGGGGVTYPLLAPDGLVTAPSYSWSNETNSGWYRPASHSFTFAVNGVNTFNIGVGTAQIAGVFFVNDGTVGAPGYSWGSETTSGFYRAGLKDMRATVNSADVNRWTDHNFDMGYKVVAGDGTTFYYPTGISNVASFGLIARFNRVFMGTEALEGAQLNQSPISWVSSAYNNVNPNAFGSLNITNQIGGYPISAATRTSDFRTAFASASGGSGAYFLGLNDDTGAGGPIASALNATAVRNSASVTGASQALQCDVENRGNTVDDTPWALGSGDTRGITITNGAFFNPVNPASAGIYIGSGNGASPGNFRKGILVANNALDINVGTFGGGTFCEVAVGAGIRWIASNGTIINEMGCTINGAGAIFALRGGNIGIWPGIGFGGTVTQATSITTAVTLNKTCGQITTVSFAWTAGFANGQAFIVNNTTVTAIDTIVVNVSGGTGNYICFAGVVNANSFQISLIPLITVTEAVTINFMVFKNTTS